MIPKDRANIKNEPPAPQVSEGLHDFEIVDVVEEPMAETKFGVKDLLRVYCAVLDGKERGQILSRRISRAYTAGFEGGSSSHLYDLACAVKKDILEDTEPFNINDLIGGFFKGKVVHNKDSQGRLWANIVKVKDAPADVEKLDAGEKQYAKDLVANIEDKRAVPKTREPSADSSSDLPDGSEDVDPSEVSA